MGEVNYINIYRKLSLSRYVECASGRTAIFSIMVGNHPPQTNYCATKKAHEEEENCGVLERHRGSPGLLGWAAC